jgi:hypothetical protein
MQLNQLQLERKQHSEAESHSSNYQIYDQSHPAGHPSLPLNANIADASTFSASINKHSSSKSKIVLKPSQIIKVNQANSNAMNLASTQVVGS